MCVPVSLHTSYSMANKKALVDSRVTNNFIHPCFAERMGLGSRMLSQPQKIWNIDGTPNKGGLLTRYIDLDIQTKGIHKEMCFLITNLGGEDIIPGLPHLNYTSYGVQLPLTYLPFPLSSELSTWAFPETILSLPVCYLNWNQM